MAKATKLNPADFCGPIATPQELKLAKKLASHYHAMCKAKSIFSNPFNPLIPIEAQSIFTHFIKAARLVMEYDVEVDPKLFVSAQFEGLSWSKKVPWPSQLYSDNARLRFADFMNKRTVRKERTVAASDFVSGIDFSIEEKKAKRMAANMGVSVKRLLKTLPREFSKAFLKKQGVWDLVQAKYSED